MFKINSRNKFALWQVLFIGLGTTWLFAPILNKTLADKTTLISQYESASQAFSIYFRLGDVLAGLLLIAFAVYFLKRKNRLVACYLLLIIGIGMVLDPLIATTCRIRGVQCVEYISTSFLIHAVETVITAASIFILSGYDALKRKQLTSIIFVIFQIVYGLFYASQYAKHHHFSTISQYIYQLSTIIWLAWFARDFFYTDRAMDSNNQKTIIIRYAVGFWAVANGFLAILLSLPHMELVGRIRGLYFANDTAWLAQHGVVVGVVMLYLGRHLIRGERRARQIFLFLIGIEVLKYSIITPHWALLSLYAATFCLLFAIPHHFNRGTRDITWEIRLKDLYYMVIALLFAVLLALIMLDRDNKVSVIAHHSFSHFYDYALHSDRIRRIHKNSVLLADTTTAFLLASIGTILWILFRPYETRLVTFQDYHKVRAILGHYSNSSEDYFKLWPKDKQYFWNQDMTGFIAYKIVGSVAFALADPIASKGQQPILISHFIDWCRTKRLRVCFLPITAGQLDIYKDLNDVQIGASALIDSSEFLNETSRDKWWRWKRNRATKQGLSYHQQVGPHSDSFLEELRIVSEAWLATDNHEERGFALGYFDKSYLQNCVIHCLRDPNGKLVAFANQLPTFHSHQTATIDLLRHLPEASDAMPYLLFRIIETTHNQGRRLFDLGFVPFATNKGALWSIARTLSADRFSAKGLEQFKNKFDPKWQPNYLAYDGDLADLVAIAANLEKAMKLRN